MKHDILDFYQGRIHETTVGHNRRPKRPHPLKDLQATFETFGQVTSAKDGKDIHTGQQEKRPPNNLDGPCPLSVFLAFSTPTASESSTPLAANHTTLPNSRSISNLIHPYLHISQPLLHPTHLAL